MSNKLPFHTLNKQLKFHGTTYVVLTSTSSTVKINGNSKTNSFQSTKLLEIETVKFPFIFYFTSKSVVTIVQESLESRVVVTSILCYCDTIY